MKNADVREERLRREPIGLKGKQSNLRIKFEFLTPLTCSYHLAQAREPIQNWAHACGWHAPGLKVGIRSLILYHNNTNVFTYSSVLPKQKFGIKD